INETSPYLLQHAHNPVDWQPWSQEALKKAETENKLVLVSIGYSSCHWCHVMEEETFEDEEVAKIMNKDFVSIKVDREERPDVDQVYMTALRLLKDDVGWPLNVITLPNGKPLYGGTYHTKEQWTQVLQNVSSLYKEDPVKANEYADMLAQGIQDVYEIKPANSFDGLAVDTLKASVSHWKNIWDLNWGGHTGQEKFMLPSNLDFLMDYAELTKDEDAKRFVKTTLDKMALGGIYDHVGGGFYRYSTDSYWKVPHFEKMLYDNAQLISLYSKAYTIYGEPTYKSIVQETIAFLDREMKHPKGGYYAAMDADSEGEEGKFYVWTEDELNSVLVEDFEFFSDYYNIDPGKAWEDQKYVLHKSLTDSAFAKQQAIDTGVLEKRKEQWKSLLLAKRANRVKPGIDDKIITSWNALLINGMIDAYKAFGDLSFLIRAETIYNVIKENSYKKGRLIHSFKENSRQTEGFLEDYAFMGDAALNLYGATMNEAYLNFARDLNEVIEKDFYDHASGLYKYRGNNALISKIIKTDDGPMPSPNAVVGLNLLRLGHIDYNTAQVDKAKKMLSSLLPDIQQYAGSYAKWNKLFLQTVYPYYEIAVVGTNAGQLIREINTHHLPNTLVVGSEKESDLPLFKSRFVVDDTFIYVCQNTTCKLPVTSTSQALEQLRNF
ncbi:MAG: thioredoxin domain-containing protein, partial [Flavobacteriaceae bacterium]